MPIHTAMTSRFHLLEGRSTFQQFAEDPAVAGRREAFEEHPDTTPGGGDADGRGPAWPAVPVPCDP
jgi:hypothetical protein